MKKASTILSHLVNQPQFRSLKPQRCYRKFLSLLTPKWQKAIAFVYVKNDTLHVVLSHPGFKMELNYNKDLLKSVLTQLASIDPDCQMLKASKVNIFTDKYRRLQQEKRAPDTIPYYHEFAKSEFEIETDDPELRAKFEAIKESIRCNR